MIDGKNNVVAGGAGLGLVGMSAYYLPITKERFVETAFSLAKDDANDSVEKLNDSALALTKGRLNAEQKLYLSQEGLAEDVVAINGKIKQLKESVTEDSNVKALKEKYADMFADCKKDCTLRDSLATRAFKHIKWINFAWGVAIATVLGAVLGATKSSKSNVE